MPTETAERRPRAARPAAPRLSQEPNANALILTSVTAVLKNLLENGLIDYGVTASIGGDVTISALPPDRIKTGEEERPQLNLFLYQISPKGLYSHSRYAPEPEEGAPRGPRTTPALDLHYLLTSYGAQDFHLEVLLGYAIEMFLEVNMVPGDEIQKILTTVSSTEGGRVVLPALTALSSFDLARQIEQIKIGAQVTNPEELSRIWTSLQAKFRPSAVYKVTVTLRKEAAEEA